tara:strand:- start:158 stop:496 length:339 start_codon:yes stop_codon:yes gene_type:complete
MTILNKIILTFAGDLEAYQHEDRIETKSGKTFKTLKKLIDHYTNEEKKKLQEREKQKKLLEDKERREKEILEENIKVVYRTLPNIKFTREEIIKKLDEEGGDIVNTIMELGY